MELMTVLKHRSVSLIFIQDSLTVYSGVVFQINYDCKAVDLIQ